MCGVRIVMGQTARTRSAASSVTSDLARHRAILLRGELVDLVSEPPGLAPVDAPARVVRGHESGLTDDVMELREQPVDPRRSHWSSLPFFELQEVADGPERQVVRT